jgi:DNA-binding transcriptional regulator YiaG
MNAKEPNKPKRPSGADRPFPWRCRHCGKDQVRPAVVSYDAEVRHDGRLYQFKIPRLEAPVCAACKKMVVTEDVDDQINAALRAHLQLLTPAEIEAALARVGLTQKDAAECIGVAEATLSRWLNESQIQTRALDNLLRAFFAFPEVRAALNGKGQDPRLGTSDTGAATT